MRPTGVNLVDLRENQQGVKSCNCKKSNCLKLYCDCFASSSYCSVQRCNCTACFNNLGSENSRRIAVIATVERNPNAFRSKILSTANSTSSSTDQSAAEVALHHKGCHCKKSNCLKKYCECFQLGIVCSDRCRCNNCKNFPGSVERNNIFAQKDSHFIRKTESVLNMYGGIHSQVNNYFSHLDTASSSSSASSPSLPSSGPSSSSSRPPSSAPSSDESLVRRLDNLGDLLTHEVISKVCQTMLRTVISESKIPELLEKRKARTETVDDEKDHEFLLKKVKMDNINDQDENEYKNDQTNGHGSDSIGTLDEGNISQQSEENLSEEATKTMITSIIRAFGVSILSAVRSQPSHNEVDMSLGIAGLHSLKEREKDLPNIRIQIPDGPIDVMDMTRTSGILALVSELCSDKTTPLLPNEEGNPLDSSTNSVFSYSKTDPSKVDMHAFNCPQSSEEEDETEMDTDEDLLSRKVSQTSRSLSINSATTTEDQWSQDQDVCHITNEKTLAH